MNREADTPESVAGSVPCVIDLIAAPALWPWPDCCQVRFELLDLNVEAVVHATRELALQLNNAASEALREWVEQCPIYDLELFDRDGRRSAATTFDEVRVEAPMNGDDWASPLFDAIVPRVFTQLLTLPLADIEFLGFMPSSID